MSNVSCVVAYPSTNKDGGATKFDMQYYLSTHMTMIDKYWAPHGMKSWEVQTFPKEKSLDVRGVGYLKDDFDTDTVPGFDATIYRLYDHLLGQRR